MTTPKNSSDPGNQQGFYSGAEARWHDLERIGQLIVPIAGLIFLAMMYAIVGFVFLHIGDWTPSTSNFPAPILYLLRIMIVILLPLVASAIGISLIVKEAQTFTRILYEPPEETKLAALIRRRLLGVPPLPPPLSTVIKYPFITIKEPTLDEGHWARWLGGPATLVIYDGVAVYLERGNRFSRVVGPGLPMPFLDRHERIREVIDLRPQVITGEISPWTKDGIQIKLSIRAECQVDASSEARAASAKFVYPFDPVAVKNAVEHTTVKYDGQGKRLFEAPWREGVWGSVTGFMSAYVASHSIDELFLESKEGESLFPRLGPEQNNKIKNLDQILAGNISEESLNKINGNLAKFGSRVLNVQVTNISIPDEVAKQWTDYWESEKQKIAILRDSRAEADRIRIREQAHAEAQRAMLRTIIQKLGKMDPENLTEPLLMSLSGVIDQGLDDPLIRPLLAKESFAVLERIRKLLTDRF